MAISTPTSTTANLLYLTEPEQGVRAYQTSDADPTTGERKRNFGHERKDMVIENLRGKEDSVTLDTAGFQYFNHKSKHDSFANDQEIYREYYPESIELIKSLTGASKVAAVQVHVDQTNKSAITRVHRHLPADEAPELLKRRFQIINLWRPIVNPAIDWPLGLCDYRSVAENDSFPMALIFPDREGETLGVKYNPNHKWKYLHGMTPEEIVLIKCFDSKQDGSVALFTPHTGFSDPSTPEGTPFRQSIELRALVFYD
ncbi:hypothetical protein M413DRAFT_25865 [Hebeloma cylindrosporum]|uniref:Methyltransferase n=1 Tax=Hebeloma cylindrosporum TaxID=76867 RepID=A0A0C2YR35_HEBCY|nr:hypothetical protein M413DRAFT_25865 [Hebeloma cylindrosporum h7]